MDNDASGFLDRSSKGPPPDMSPEGVTTLLGRVNEGDGSATDDLMRIVMEELRAMARARMHREQSDHTLQATALVNEAYVRVFGSSQKAIQNRRHLFGAFANAMRQVLIDQARRRRSDKRGGGAAREPLQDQAAQGPQLDAIEVDDLLSRLEQDNPRAAEVARLKFFAGLKDEETAEVLQVSVKTIRRNWSVAKEWFQEHGS